MPHVYFSTATFRFLRALDRNNNREWFHTHKDDYERHVREPFIQLLTDLQAPLASVRTTAPIRVRTAAPCFVFIAIRASRTKKRRTSRGLVRAAFMSVAMKYRHLRFTSTSSQGTASLAAACGTRNPMR
jgi:hypothetical protein